MGTVLGAGDAGLLYNGIMLNAYECLEVAVSQARKSFHEGGVPIGAALFDEQGNILGVGHNRRVQDDDPVEHAEIDAFRNAGRQRDYRSTTMVTTLAPCWLCSGLMKQFKIGHLIVGEDTTFQGGVEWLREAGVKVTVLDDPRCKEMMHEFIAAHPEVWNEDIGE